MQALINTVETEFYKFFHHENLFVAQAPGRVNLIGEHTDYNDGFVFPCAINYQTILAASKRDDDKIFIYAIDYQESDEFSLSKPIEFNKERMWANYIRGIFAVLLKKYNIVSGINIAISGNIPQGAGLSSSASLEVAVATLLNHVFNLNLSVTEIAIVSQKAENNFVGCNCGIMDQLISAIGINGKASLIDCRKLSYQAVNLPEGYDIVIVNSNKKRELVDSAYNERRKQCEDVANFFGVKALRDVNLKTFNKNKHHLNPIIAKRARHVITENLRALEMLKALNNADIEKIAALMWQSHESMKNDFEITIPEIDSIVDSIRNNLGSKACVRMTGGGFGGCVVALIPHEKVANICIEISKKYQATYGFEASIYICQPSQGASIIRK